MFASQTTDTVTIGDIVVTIQKLNWKAQRRAAKVQHDAFLAQAKALAETTTQSSDDFKKALAEREAERAAEKSAPQDPVQLREQRYGHYDRETVLEKGVKSWTTDVKLADGLSDLDEESADRLHRAILDLTLPAIDGETREADRKND